MDINSKITLYKETEKRLNGLDIVCNFANNKNRPIFRCKINPHKLDGTTP
jgi:hypothetical protein